MSKDAEPWSTSALRVDQFTYDEWPEQPLATVEDFSVGEEQSDSVAVSALWSSSGVGMHRRCVLGVLTSNLLFSIWETNGFDRGWRRTYILNHLPRIESASTQSASLPKRWRIRAFAWSATLKKSEEDRWGEQFLIVADDDDNLTLLSVRKARRGQYGTWEVHAICTTSLKSSDRTSAGRVVPKSLHSQITRGSSIERLEMHDWNIATSGHRPDNERLIATARITYRTSNSHTPSSVSVTLTCSQGHIDGTFGPSSHDTDSAMTSSLAGIDVAAQRLKKEPQWRQALDDCCDAYRKTYELNVSRYRLWTLAIDPAGMYEVACVTLHPVEAFEYTSAIQEKTRLIFTRRNSANLPSTTQQNLKDVDQVLASSLQVVTKCGGDPNCLSTDIDRTMIQLFYTAAGYSSQYEDERVLLREMLEFQPNADVGVIGSDAQNVRAGHLKILFGMQQAVSESAQAWTTTNPKRRIKTIG
ncbi:hypothetical protein LTR64_004242 [Lithohypha guttulata]|uniref:Transcription factor IIIC 90kDa subunit N-terminal domain-containing protein n=1 Tax=Lithohypha guttulata TaxID=1690604 RepID=A0AAN7T3A9_9EURO|nr:hypothetical protein LTR05_002891 [Lithohypha guttulata]